MAEVHEINSGGRRARHGKRKRCSDPQGKGCKGFARRGSTHCYACGGGTRAEKKHTPDGTIEGSGRFTVSPRVLAILSGEVPVEELDDEELIRGFTRSKNGTFAGVSPRLVPKAIHDRFMRELMLRGDIKLRENFVAAAEFMGQLVQDETADSKDRIKAAQWIYERVGGKTPDVTVNISEKRWEGLLDKIDRSAGSDIDYIEAEIVDDGREP